MKWICIFLQFLESNWSQKRKSQALVLFNCMAVLEESLMNSMEKNTSKVRL